MKNSIKILSLVFSAVLLVSSFMFPVSAQSESDFQDKIDYWDKFIENSEKSEANNLKILEALDEQNSVLNEQIEAKQADIAPLQQRINELNEQISALNKQIATLETEIKDIEIKTEEQNKAIDETYEILGQRLRASYMAGETSELELFLNSESFEDFLTRSELLRQVAKHDNEVIAGLEVKVKELNQMLEELTAKRTEVEESKVKIEADKKEQEEKKAVHDKKLASLENDQAKVEANIAKQNKILETDRNNQAYGEQMKAKWEKEFAEWTKQVEAEAGNSGSTGDGFVSGGGNHNFKKSSKGYISPIQDKSVYYSATYAQHSSRGSKAVDFCAPANRVYTNGKTYYTSNGAKVYAVASGKVVAASFQTTGGNYVIIDHGNGMRTMYAHLRSYSVSTGQSVSQGDVIGLVGNTGSAVYPRPTTSNPVNGSHLHFQMILNGNPVNPEQYLPSPLV